MLCKGLPEWTKVHAIRYVIDYSSIALMNLSKTEISKLETIQNKCMRLILGAPKWTRLVNLREESQLVSLETRIQQMVAGIVSKVVSRHDNPLAKSFKKLINKAHTITPRMVWHRKILNSLEELNLLPVIKERGLDISHPNYTMQKPWVSPLANFHFNTLPLPKALCNLQTFYHIQEIVHQISTRQDTATIFTDGSVDQRTGKAGSAFVCGDFLKAKRISDNSSTLQAELVAIKDALNYSIQLVNNTIYIMTDSLSAIHSLQKIPPNDNIRLITTILFKLQQLTEQGKAINFMWIPSHSGIKQNDQADRTAKDSLKQIHVSSVQPSLGFIKKLAKRTSFQISLIQHQVWAQVGSSSARWYQKVTNYERIIIPRSMGRKEAVILHRLRLGYRCNWEINERILRNCQYCDATVSEPLLHYILACPVLEDIRPHQYKRYNLQDPSDALSAADCISQILNNEKSFYTLCKTPPPR